MADRRVGVEDRVDRLHVRARNFAAVVSVMGDTHKAGHLDHSCAVCTVADDQHLILRTQCAAQYGFHSIAAAALQQYGGVAFGGRCQCGQLLADLFYHADIVIIIPGTAIEQHRFFHGARGGERARSQQQIVTRSHVIYLWSIPDCIYHDDLCRDGSKRKSRCNKKFISACIMAAGKTEASKHEIYPGRYPAVPVDQGAASGAYSERCVEKR